MCSPFVEITDLDCVAVMDSELNQPSSYEILESLGLSIMRHSSVMDQRDFGVLRELPVWSSMMFGISSVSQMISALQKNSLASWVSFGSCCSALFWVSHRASR